ncbi:toprim domain-containing protein [Streptomyces sp. NBC_00841]|uniref:toprim domain-containing protein n=1 Tax=Streptomyces sp. NBC_00841 TaxID=2975847 RepID=UPI002DD8307A|nr:toprim domain-containing protein [Streptomyces sp. NBC_00841]WRZ98045.1 toprim domain-containing protein [Streptomyces sp. NBC_00841]
MQFTEILGRFQQVTEGMDGGYLALCSAHDDSRPSLRIWLGDNGKVRMTCRAGCATNDVRKAAGLRWPDMFNATGEGLRVPKERPKLVGPGQIAALASYIDLAGQNLRGSGSANADIAAAYAAERFGITPGMFEDLELGLSDDDTWATLPYLSRAFLAFPRLVVPLCDFDGVPRGLQGRDLTGDCPVRWVSLMNPEGMRWAPYGVFQGAGGHGVTIVSEGLSDGLTAVAAGYDALPIRGASLVNNPDLLAELAAGLKDQRVIAAGDNDKSGREFNRRLAEGLKPFGIDVRALPIPNLGPKSDLTDWRESDPAAFRNNLHSAVRQCAPVRENKAKLRRMEALMVATLGETK